MIVVKTSYDSFMISNPVKNEYIVLILLYILLCSKIAVSVTKRLINNNLVDETPYSKKNKTELHGFNHPLTKP